DGTKLWLANEIGEFQVWDLATHSKVNTIKLPGGGGFSMAQNPANGQLYIGTSYYGRGVVVIDPQTYSLRNIATGGTVRRIGFLSSGTVGIVANEGGWVDFIH
ncbi:MAG TPA: hypothetical protein VGI92_13815, partial [Gemmatimonadales bacterium]